MSQALTLRLPDEDAEEVRRIARKERRSVSDVAARIVDEWLRLNRFPQIEFRSVNGERVACIKGRLEVWQVIMVAQDHGGDVAQAAEHLNLRHDQVQAALNYRRVYPAEIDEALAENSQGFDRLKRLLPQIERTSITEEDLAGVPLATPPP